MSVKKISPAIDSLLSRETFRERVFSRDGGECVVCHMAAQDAHHIIERRLFPDGGYYLSNGASLCGRHHIEAEQTNLTVEKIREYAGIVAPAIPPHFYPDERYDKWGNIYLPNGLRTKGELFHDQSVQRILKAGGVLKQFTNYVKYPRTLHLPWSPGATSDDRVMTDLTAFEGEDVVITEKMDGENTSLYDDYYHARSVDSKSHPSQSWARAYHAQFAWNIPPSWRICAENLYARHSISYSNLKSFLLVFSIWDETNTCLSWGDTVEWSKLLNLKTVPVLYQGKWDIDYIKKLASLDRLKHSEGYVVRVSRGFQFPEFRKVVGKYVRENHNQSSHNWKAKQISLNKLADG